MLYGRSGGPSSVSSGGRVHAARSVARRARWAKAAAAAALVVACGGVVHGGGKNGGPSDAGVLAPDPCAMQDCQGACLAGTCHPSCLRDADCGAAERCLVTDLGSILLEPVRASLRLERVVSAQHGLRSWRVPQVLLDLRRVFAGRILFARRRLRRNGSQSRRPSVAADGCGRLDRYRQRRRAGDRRHADRRLGRQSERMLTLAAGSGRERRRGHRVLFDARRRLRPVR